MMVACLIFSRGAAPVSAFCRTLLIGTGIVWGSTAPLFLAPPTALDGIYERSLAAVSCVLVLTIARLFCPPAKQLKAT